MITFQFNLYLDPADLHVLPRGQRREERVELRHHPDGATRVDAPHVRSGVVATYDDNLPRYPFHALILCCPV